MLSTIDLICAYCKQPFVRLKSNHVTSAKNTSTFFCCRKCFDASREDTISVICLHCGVSFEKNPYQARKYPNHFCSRSCAATWNNSHKTTGTRRSKLEAWLEIQLLAFFPNLDFKFNSKEAINSELDIYIPSLQLAFELNGIYHYEPIHGVDKLTSIQNNDNRKFAACIENNIELCIINSSVMKSFTEKRAQKYLDIIIKIIFDKVLLSEGGGIEPQAVTLQSISSR